MTEEESMIDVSKEKNDMVTEEPQENLSEKQNIISKEKNDMVTEEPQENLNEKQNIKEESKEQNKEVKKEIKDSTSVKRLLPPSGWGNSVPNMKYRVKVSGLPRFYSSNDPLLTEFKKMLTDELKLDLYYIRSPKKGNSWLYITFTNQADQEKALQLLKRYTWKNRTIICTVVVADVLKRKGDDNHDVNSKKAKLDIPLEEQMLMSTIPYHTIGYDEQLSKKNEEASCHLKWLFELIQKRTFPLSAWIEEQTKKYDNNLPFALDELKPSPLIDGYRNRCEFRIGLNPQNQEVTVGYRVDNQEDGSIWVAPPDSLRHLPKQMIEVVKAFSKFVKGCPYPPQINEDNSVKGIWRLLLTRINRQGEILVVFMIHPGDNDVSVINQVKQLLIDYFVKGEGNNLNIVSMYLQVDLEKSSGLVSEKKQAADIEHLWGATYLEESILDLNLEVTPSLYFHWNTYGAEQLYAAVRELAQVDKETTVLDICCGSGGMGLTLAKYCKDLLGVELMDVNVEDAKKIAAKNGLTNCEFMQGKIDEIFPQIHEKVENKKVIAILDPPRNGISQRMIINLRNLKEADKVIYVCSNHKLPLKNLLDLATLEPGPFANSNPFVPTRVIPVDMTPHALRCELVILCERIDMNSIPKPTGPPPVEPKKERYRKRGGRLVKERQALKAQRARFGFGFGFQPSRFDSVRFSHRDAYTPPPPPPPLRRSLYNEPQRGYSDLPRRDYFDDYPGPRRGPPRRLMDTFNSRFGNNYDQGFRDSSYSSRDMGFGEPRMNPRVDTQERNPRGIPSLFDTPFRPLSNFDKEESRYSNFRHDVEDAFNYPQFRSNNRFSLESAILEREKRAFAAGLTRGLRNIDFDDSRPSYGPGKRGQGGNGIWR